MGKGHGLAGLVDRLAGVDGSLELQSPEGGPTVLRAAIPFPPRPATRWPEGMRVVLAEDSVLLREGARPAD